MDSTGGEITLKEIVDILSRKRYAIIAITLLFIVAAILYLLVFAKNIYDATAIISVNPSDVQSSLEDKIELGPLSVINTDTLKVLLKSKATIVRVSQRLKEDDRSEIGEWAELSDIELANLLQKVSKVRVLKPSDKARPGVLVAEIKVQLPDPKLAALVANAWAETAVSTIDRLYKDRVKARVEVFSKQAAIAHNAYQEAQVAMRNFRKSTNLEGWKRELGSRIDRGIGLEKQIDELTRRIAEKRAKIAKISQVIDNERIRVVGQPSPGKLVLQNRSLSDARAELSKLTKHSRQVYESAASAYEHFQASTPLARWKAELQRYLDRIGSSKLKLETLSSDKRRVKAQLDKVEELLASTPDRITLKKSLAADPELLSLIGGNVTSVEGLTLDSEVINSVHSSLLNRRNELISQMASLSKEESVLNAELSKLDALANDLRRKISESETKQRRLQLQLQVAKSDYLRWAGLEASYQGIEGDYQISPDNAYFQALHESLRNEEISLTALESELKGLQRSLEDNNAAITSLKERVSDAELQSERLQESLRLSKAKCLALAQKEADLNIELAGLQEGRAHLLARAYPDNEPVAPRRALLLVLSAVLGLMSGVFYAFISAALEEPVDTQQSKDTAGLTA